jgi:putative isomerase
MCRWATHLSTCLSSYALARYGRIEDAKEIAGRLVRTFAADLQANGCIHEYYCGDTGQPLSKPGFLSWNLLAGRILDDLENEVNPLLFSARNVISDSSGERNSE